MHVVLIVGLLFMAAATLTTLIRIPLLVDKQRRPMTGSEASGAVVFSTFYLVLLVWAVVLLW